MHALIRLPGLINLAQSNRLKERRSKMKKLTKGLCLSAAIVTAGATLSTSAMAEPVFKVDESVLVGGGNLITSDRIQVSYQELAQFTPTNIVTLDGDFDISINMELNSFLYLGSSVPGSYLSFGSYGMYATFVGQGSYNLKTSGDLTQGADFSFTSGALTLWLDPNGDTNPGTDGTGQSATSAWVSSASGDDLAIAVGSILSGSGELDPDLTGCVSSTSTRCGSFDTNTTFDLNALGKTIFVDPAPFYDLTFASGTLRNFTPSGVQYITGDGSVIFGRVPEPATLALFGLGLAGMAGVARRKSKQA